MAPPQTQPLPPSASPPPPAPALKPAPPSRAWQPAPSTHLVRRRGRQQLSATLAVAMLLFSGSTLVGIAIATQRRPPALPAVTTALTTPRLAATTSSASTSGSPELPWLSGIPVVPSQTPAVMDKPSAPDYVALDSVALGSPAGSVAPESLVREAVVPGGPLLDPSEPVSIDIPAIGVSSVLRHLGQAANGSLEVPAGAQYNDAAWYRHSPTPGSLGPAVILGHVDSAAQGPSVFFRLGELRPGHRVTINRADGSVAVFVVDAVHRYAKAQFPTETVYSDIDHAGLRILTCGGAFDNATRSYVDNVVVFASLVDATP